jgi:hypothetical protein
MKIVSALGGLAALVTVALSNAPVSAMPIAIPGQAEPTSNVVQANWVCNPWGHCWHRPSYGYGYYHPEYSGGWGWRHRYYGHWGWHPHYYGGWGWRPWHHWHQW